MEKLPSIVSPTEITFIAGHKPNTAQNIEQLFGQKTFKKKSH